ncbi:hypothetical protein GN325_20700 [Agrobacterium vitis]|uniref:hypothetical protein n=1 Tax=Agrobacterium vitis TaxID=373 RepID=UPI0012E8420E|nr:hypothetical protein [Agrobacterium vitis]MVA47350.1 hypothetical protein [Agrobacterium vitis]MVB04187.1 hypothetical protein [Agrobacterium vitis]
MARFFAENQYLKLKRATEASYERAGGVKLAQECTRVVLSTLSRYSKEDKQHEELFIPIDIAVDIDRMAKRPLIIETCAELLGYALVPLESRIASAEALSEDDAFRIMDEATELWRMTRLAFADGKIDALERKQLRIKLHDLIAACHIILEKLEA